MKIISSLAMLW